MENKKEFIGEITRYTHSPDAKRHRKRITMRSKYLGIPVSILIAASFIGGAALIGFVWQTYSVNISGDIDINGETEEEVSVYYDDVQLTGTSMDITTMDHATLGPGDTYTNTHTFENTDGRNYHITVDTSAMPLEYVDTDDIWYGFTFKVYEHGTTTEVTEFDLTSLSTVTLDFYYDVNELFEEPVIAFPFNLVFDIEEIVNRAPTATDDTSTGNQNSDKTITVTTNDFDIDGDAVHVISATWVSGTGSITSFTDDTVTIHIGNDGGARVFTYVISDPDGLTDEATVSVSVAA